MKTKLFYVVALLLFVAGSSFAQNNPTQNALTGAPNFYQSLYGTTQGSSRGAMDAVVYIDYVVDPNGDFVVAGLLNLGYTVNVATGWADFNSKLVSGNYGLAVGFRQMSSSQGGADPQAMQTFMNAGGCIIYTDWNMENARVNVLGASFTGVANMTSMTISDPGLAGGITNPVIMSNAGWGIFTMGLTPLGGSQVLATFENGNAAVVRGNGGKSIVLGYLSDAPLFADRQQLFENVVNATLCGNGPKIPVSDWAIYLGIFLILSFVVIRYAKAS
jgi:hypothetical protein